MNMIKLYGKPVRVNKASAHQKNLDVGANIFIGNLDTEVDEKLLYDTFSAFGVILQTPKVNISQIHVYICSMLYKKKAQPLVTLISSFLMSHSKTCTLSQGLNQHNFFQPVH